MAKSFSYDWWHEHYKDVKGNIKTTILYAVITGLVTTFHFLVQGMPWWRHALVDFLFAFLALWLGASLWNANTERNSSKDDPLSVDRTSELFSTLQVETFQLAKDIGEWYEQFEPEPQMPDNVKENIDTQLRWIFECSNPWVDKLSASYQLLWLDKVEKLNLQYVLLGLGDGDVVRLSYALKGAKSLNDAIRERLVCMAHRIDGLALKAEIRD